MKFLGRPPLAALSGHDAARTGRIQDESFAARLAAASAEVDAAATRYATAAAAGTLATAGPFVLSGIQNKEMSKHYDERFARDGSPGRHVYDKLRAFAGGRCPYCRQRPVNTLDHYWPKRSHGAVALIPDNLVPACRDCNIAKGQFQPAARSGELLHPYFDAEHTDRWLKAKVDRSPEGPVVQFYPDPPSGWHADDAGRVREHFERLELNDLYSILGVDEVISIRKGLDDLLAVGEPGDVRDQLASRFVSERGISPNSWRTALYGGLALDTWFWSGGFNAF